MTDLSDIKTQQQGVWDFGDHVAIAQATMIVAEKLCERFGGDLLALRERRHISGDGSAVVPSGYLDVVAIRP